MSDAARKRIKAALQALVSVCLIIFVFRQLDLEQVRSVRLDMQRLPLLAVALLLFNLSKAVSARRLNLYQRHAGILLSERENLQLYYAGMFLNLFLPGGIGGDGYKILVLHRRGAASVRTLLWVTLLDRVSGLLILVFLACMMTPFLTLPWPAEPVYALSATGGMIVVVIILLTHLRWLHMGMRSIGSACGYGFAVQLLQIACMAALLACLHVPLLHYLQYLWVFLVSSVAAALPVSVGGLGVREVTFLYCIRMLHLEPTMGVVASSVFALITVLSSLAGALFLKRFPLGNPNMARGGSDA
ncbi:MAG TPA: lysylphosphatidylglycerol synthase transmembrane domain-containing protein [Noviherbaspirillum sp.]|nr:lysylphosphatidylglycerol synthase transmembrane domain-containing protein [Noviherbaspirillum sp.]